MKTIEERAKEAWSDYEYREGDLYNTCFIDGFLAGAKSEQADLLRWRDPKEELPKENKQVLIKTDQGIRIAFHWGNGEFIIQQGGMGYIDLQPEEIRDDTWGLLYDVIGWRQIYELPEAGEKIVNYGV